MKRLHIKLGTTSKQKIKAVEEACCRLGIRPIISCKEVASGQNEQPFGFNETYAGAFARAYQALEITGVADIAIGIESGVFALGEDFPLYLDLAVVVVLTTNERQITTTSTGVQFPTEYVDEAYELGFETTTVGSIITKHLGGDKTDPHSVLTDEKVTRTMTLVDALVTALRQI